MGMEVMSNDEAIYEAEEGYLSDSEAFSSIVEVLDGVRKAPNMIAQGDRDQYDFLVSIVDPAKKMNPDEEALLVTALKALSGAVFRIDSDFHGSLLSNIFDMPIWSYGSDARNALLELITSLAAVPDKFLDSSLHMLVSNFVAPRRLRESISESRWIPKKKEVHDQLHMALHYIADLVPLAPMKLRDVIDRRMPRHTDPKEVILMYVECMLGLESGEIGEFLGSTLLKKVVDLLIDLDVNISWEDILQEDHNKGIFDMDMDDALDNADDVGRMSTKAREETKVLKGNAFAEKLDGLMVIMCEHLNSSASKGHLVKAFETLVESFRSTVMNAYKSKFTQFVIFYACSLDPEKFGKMFADLLTDIFVSKTEDPVSRMSAVAYLASYLSRARFISSHHVAMKLKRLVDWCFEYCQFRNGREMSINPKGHQVFYAGCQAVMYILCFRMRLMMDVPELKSLIFRLPLQSILHHPLKPLEVCLPTIVDEFNRQAAAAHLLDISKPSHNDVSLESEFSKAFGGLERLDMSFPFDPYLLKESDRFIRPNYEYWCMVRTTYSDFSSDEEHDPDGTCIADDGESSEDYDNLDSENDGEDLEFSMNDGEDLEFSMNKMSITPRPTSKRHPMGGNIHNPVQMPAKLTSCVSL